MATRTFTSMVQFQAMIEPMITKAVQNTCNRLLGTLQEIILTRYYDLFTPDRYSRTYSFFDSAVTQMLNNMTGEIFMDESVMNYGDYWDGQTQLYMADAGYHGSTDIKTEGQFWKEFISFCDQNAIKILKEELAKQGLKTV